MNCAEHDNEQPQCEDTVFEGRGPGTARRCRHPATRVVETSNGAFRLCPFHAHGRGTPIEQRTAQASTDKEKG